MARAVMTQLIQHGEVRRGRLGIEMGDLTPEVAKKLGVASLDGAAIGGVQKGSPAEKAGLRAGDIVTHLNGRPIHSAAELRARLGLTPVGEQVELRLARGATQSAVRVQIAPPEAADGGTGQAVAQLPGMRIIEIERGSQLYQQLRGGGLVVTAVEPKSAAFTAGVRAGDIIYAVNRRRVQTAADLQKSLRGAERYAISLLRGDFSLTIVVR
jgi:serine protease DegQ